ncbi:putative ISXo8 transposase [Xanthomonas oryzae pv. oryzae KACC 10331]|uniref:ISXo8 transposase n=1 Tax=Xanthomonas oryzae pv. oryzae (strain KACC10331 / KXO85) TaxID=291331 RepID=Q05I70_XANOR|nr:putative ISXo8 transposase [Xanthomonas oryzae pv. oryzae KACC 10331]
MLTTLSRKSAGAHWSRDDTGFSIPNVLPVGARACYCGLES